MICYANRIFMSEELAELYHNSPEKFADAKCEFTYLNVKTGKESTHSATTQDAFTLAERRRDDKRYRNFEFIIS